MKYRFNMTIENFFLLICVLGTIIADCASKNEIWIGAFLTVDVSAGGWSSEGVLPAIQMAIEDVNNDSTVLTDYDLRMEWRDTKCQRGYGVKQLVDLLHLPNNRSPTMLIGGGCSVGTEATAEASYYWNLIQIAFSANSMRLSDKNTYPKLFRTCYSESIGNPARVSFLKKFGWTKIAIIYQDEGLFSLTVEQLRKMLDNENITSLTSESLQKDPTYQVRNIKNKDARIIIGMFYSDMARKVFCRAYKEGMYGAPYQWLVPGWFKIKWWEDATKEGLDCTPAQIKLAAGNYIAIMESTWSSDPRVTINGQTAEQLNKRYLKRVSKSLVNEYCVFGYDAVWAVALTLNKSIETLQTQGKTIEQFNFNDSSMAEVFKKNLENLQYQGMSGKIKFDEFGDRIGLVIVEQLQDDAEVKVGEYDAFQNVIRFNGKKIYWQEGEPPVDHTKINLELQAISLPLFIVVSIIASLGILFATGLLGFNIYFSDRRFIRMSSPRLNSITVIGSILVYTSVIISGLDGRFLTESQYTYLCQAQLWVLCIGFTLAYGAMFSKTWRVHILFLKKRERRSIKDHQLLAMVAGLLVIDVIVLITWQIMDPLRYARRYQPVIQKYSHPSIAKRPYNEYCSSEHSVIWKGVILGYKGILMIFGAFLAWETRKVTIPALNDSKNIGVSVYTVVLTCIVGLPVLMFITTMQNFSYGLGAAICVLCTSVTLSLMFIPKILMLNKEEATLSTMNERLAKRNSITPIGFTNCNLSTDHEKSSAEVPHKQQTIQKEHEPKHPVVQNKINLDIEPCFANSKTPETHEKTDTNENMESPKHIVICADNLKSTT